MPTVSLASIKAHYQPGPGRHWFDRSTMRFFRSKLPRTAYVTTNGMRAYFVTSEQFVGSMGAGLRKYTVRAYDFATRQIDTVGAFNTIACSATARSLAQFYADF